MKREEIANRLNKYLKENDWNFSYDGNKYTFQFNLTLDSRIHNISYTILVREEDYMVTVKTPIGTDKNDSALVHEMACFICRANYGLPYGCFQFDLRDGEIGYRQLVDCEDVLSLPDAVISNSIVIPATTIKRYAPGILGILFSDMTAEDAIKKCEK